MDRRAAGPELSAAASGGVAGEGGKGSIRSCANGWSKRLRRRLTFCRLPVAHPKQLKSTHLLERLYEEIQRHTQVVRIFPNEWRCPGLIRARAVEMHENWIAAIGYPNMEELREHKKHPLQEVASAAAKRELRSSPFNPETMSSLAETSGHNIRLPSGTGEPSAAGWSVRLTRCWMSRDHNTACEPSGSRGIDP